MTNQRDEMREGEKSCGLRLLKENPDLSRRALACVRGASTGWILSGRSTLLDKGRIKTSNFTTAEDKRRYVRVLAAGGPAGTARLTRRSLVRKLDEYGGLSAEIETMRVGLAAAEDGESKA